MKTTCRLLALGWTFGCLGGSAQELLPDSLPESPLLPPLPEAGAPAPFPETALPKIAVFEAEVAVDGQPRPDLGRAVTDALLAGFLRSGMVDVIDISGKTGGGRSPSELGREAVCDRVYVPSIFSQGDSHRMSVRQLAIPSGKVEQIYEDKARGQESELFALVERMGARLAPAPAAPVRTAPVQRPAGPIRAWMSGPPDTERVLSEAPSALPAAATRPAPPRPQRSIPRAAAPAPLKTIVFAGSRRVEIEEIGRIAAHNSDYSFCVLTLNKGRQLNPGDRVLLKIDDPAKPTLTATVTRRTEGSSVIVQYSADKPPVFPQGARAYQWVPEAETQPTPSLPAVPETTPLY